MAMRGTLLKFAHRFVWGLGLAHVSCCGFYRGATCTRLDAPAQE